MKNVLHNCNKKKNMNYSGVAKTKWKVKKPAAAGQEHFRPKLCQQLKNSLNCNAQY